jgi:hypothetical protein
MAMRKTVVDVLLFLIICGMPIALAHGQSTKAKTGTKPAAKPAPSTASAAGTVEGTFTVNGHTVPLKYVYALIKPDPFHPEKNALFVYLTDVPLEEAQLRDEFGLSEDATAGKLHAIEVKFDDEVQPLGGQVYNNYLKDAASMSVSGMHKFVPRQYEPGKIIAGRLFVKPDDFFSDKWEYTATFSAPIMSAPPREPEKEASLDSPPAQAAQAFLTAVHSMNKEAIKNTVMPDMAKDLEGEKGEMMMQMLPEIFGPKLKITKVAMVGDNKARVTLQNKEEHETVTISTERINGEWKVSRND